MNNEEEILNRIKRFLNKEEDAYATGEDIKSLLDLYKKEKEKNKKLRNTVVRAIYMAGVLDERNEWYKKINELAEEMDKNGSMYWAGRIKEFL